MRLSVKVHPKAKINLIEKIDDSHFKIKTTAPAADNQANLSVIEILTGYFQIKKSQVNLLSGVKSRDKVFEI